MEIPYAPLHMFIETMEKSAPSEAMVSMSFTPNPFGEPKEIRTAHLLAPAEYTDARNEAFLEVWEAELGAEAKEIKRSPLEFTREIVAVVEGVEIRVSAAFWTDEGRAWLDSPPDQRTKKKF